MVNCNMDNLSSIFKIFKSYQYAKYYHYFLKSIISWNLDITEMCVVHVTKNIPSNSTMYVPVCYKLRYSIWWSPQCQPEAVPESDELKTQLSLPLRAVNTVLSKTSIEEILKSTQSQTASVVMLVDILQGADLTHPILLHNLKTICLIYFDQKNTFKSARVLYTW